MSCGVGGNTPQAVVNLMNVKQSGKGSININIAILNDLGKAVVRASCSRGRDARTTVPISNGIAI